MATSTTIHDEDDISAEAVQALNAANQRARESGQARVVMIGREVVQIDAHGKKVLSVVPERIKVTVRNNRFKLKPRFKRVVP